MNAQPALAAALRTAELIHDRAALQAAIARMGGEITRALGGERALFLPVMNGAVVFAGELALAIGSDLEFDYVHASRYRGTTQGAGLQWIKRPRASLAGRTVLLADDILDEGYTLAAIRDWCLGQGAKRVLIAVLCEKRHGRRVPDLAADFIGVQVPDRYVFGYGMDFHEQGRNLPGIYALRE
ncbi:MAG: hypoxanthine-guanine phosphoribosyltransferase [Mizugakiibacter sp.]|uniref:hypoxanthine-guanine phosphoribosyltransferase n=1 Tax=Mizugakiibacter sp. TaxID=1972610 RepID=UPI0031C5AC48|nr:hypoxanthine-guanine phosphoribosyltransferase [Xanthomonadaceae bacterium]